MTKANIRHFIPWVLLLCLALAGYQFWQQKIQIEAQLKAGQQHTDQIAVLSQRYLVIFGNDGAQQQSFKEHRSAEAWLLTSAKQQGLNMTLNSANISDQVRPIELNFDEVHFNQLIRWIHTTQASSNLVVTQSQLSAHTKPGFVSGFITFEIN